MSWWRIDETHDPARLSWVASANGHRDFPIQNLPLGVFAPPGEGARIGTAIGDAILDLRAAAQAGLLPDIAAAACAAPGLNRLMALPEARRAWRRWASAALADGALAAALTPMLHDAAGCTLHLPARIGDYSDFYAGIHHAENIGRQLRPEHPLPPNYKWLPIGYHGRASSIRPSGVPLVRPRGQRKPPDADVPSAGPTQRLDYEVELGVWIGPGNALGEPIAIGAAAEHIAGLCLLNDWSARDIQAWEYQPLGPFLAKSFHSTISPWVVTAEALAPFRRAQPPRPPGDPAPLAYLADADDEAHGALAITLEACLTTAAMRRSGLAPHRLSAASAGDMYWTINQIVAHHAANGCNLRPGDLLGTGTISAPTRGGFGSLMELTTGGREPITLPSGEARGFLDDGDEVILTATAAAPGHVSIGFGDCRATIRPAFGK